MKNNISITYADARPGVDPKATGCQLKKRRLANYLTQEQLSGLFEEGGDPVSRNTISMWETGRKKPTLSHVVFLAELYNCTLDELVISYRRSREDDGCDQLVPLIIACNCLVGSYKASIQVAAILRKLVERCGEKERFCL